MILSEHERRWHEVKLYHMVLDLYAIREKWIDVVDMIEAICLLGNVKTKTLKKVVNSMMNDPLNRPFKREIVLLAHLQGYSDGKIAKYVDMTRQGARKIINTQLNDYRPVPRFSVEDDYEIKNFLETFEKLRNVGLKPCSDSQKYNSMNAGNNSTSSKIEL